MNPNSNPSLGTGSTLLGGANPAMNAMQNTGGVGGMQTQMSPSAAGYDPSLSQPSYPAMPSTQNAFPIHPVTGMPVVPPQQPQAMPAPKTEADILIEALANRLKHNSETQKHPQEVEKHLLGM